MYALPIPTIDWNTILPILLVAFGGLFALVVEMVSPKRNNGAIIFSGSVFVIAAIGHLGWQVMAGLPYGETFGEMAVRDPFAIIMQLLLCFVALFTLFFSEGYMQEKRIPFGEFYPMMLWATSGAMIMASTKSLLMLFIGLEVLSIALYALAGLAKFESKSEESAIKYFLLGAFGSAFLLYGIAFLYGASGSLHLDDLVRAAASADGMVRVPYIFGAALLLVGLCFKASLVPFHQWTPDVYQGAPTNVTAFMAAASKVAAVAALFRVMDILSPSSEVWVPILSAIAIVTMIVGNVVALLQTDVKRLFGYSSIANAGYLMVGLIARMKNPGQISPTSISFFLISYVAMTLGSFAIVSLLTRSGRESTSIKDLNGLYQRDPFAAVAFVILICSLIGIPPTAGFFGKLLIFNDALSVGLGPLAIVMAVFSVVSIAYYLGLIKAAFVDEPAEDAGERTRKGGLGLGFVIGCCMVATLLLSAASGHLKNYFDSAPPVLEVQKQEPTRLAQNQNP